MSQQQLHEIFNRKAWRVIPCKVCGKRGKSQELERVCDGCLSNFKSCLTCQHAAAMSDPECPSCCGTGRFEGLPCQECPDWDCFLCHTKNFIYRIQLARSK